MQRQNQIEQIEYGKSGRDSEREGEREGEREREEGRKQQRTIKIADKLHTRRQGEGRANPDTPTATQRGRVRGGKGGTCQDHLSLPLSPPTPAGSATRSSCKRLQLQQFLANDSKNVAGSWPAT